MTKFLSQLRRIKTTRILPSQTSKGRLPIEAIEFHQWFNLFCVQAIEERVDSPEKEMLLELALNIWDIAHFMVRKLWDSKYPLPPVRKQDKVIRSGRLMYWHFYRCIERCNEAGVMRLQPPHTTLSLFYKCLAEGELFRTREFEKFSKREFLKSFQQDNAQLANLDQPLPSPTPRVTGELIEIFKQYAEQNNEFRTNYYREFVKARAACNRKITKLEPRL